MIVNGGKLKLLNAQLTYLGNTYWHLFVNNLIVLDTTDLTDMVEASWTGYGSVNSGTWATPTIVGSVGQTVMSTNPMFYNASSSPVTFYGWYLLDGTDNTLIAAVNLGATVISPGGSYVLNCSATDTHP